MAVVVDHECSSGECGIFRDPVARITGRASASGYNVYSASVYRLEHQLQGHVLRILRGHNHTEYHTNPHMVFVLLSTWGFACVVEFVKQVLKEKQRFCLRFLLVKIIGVCCHPLCYAIILEFIDGGDLYKLLPSRKNPDPYLDKWSNRLDMARQTADGMQHLHSLQPPIIHRDLTPKNILVEKASLKYLCKITDFGLSKMRATSRQIINKSANSTVSACGTLGYVAPERFKGQPTDTMKAAKLDVYSFGVILWQFRERKRPFRDEENRLVILTNVQSGLPFDVPRCWCPPGYEALTKCCSSLDPNERPSFSEISNFLGNLIAKLEGTDV